MGDKLRDTSPISIRFAEGEIADPTKVDGVALQADRSAAILEYAIGDLWNSGGDAFVQSIGLISYALMIPNLSRYLGITSLLNPRLFNSSSVTQYTHKVYTTDVDNHEFQLSLPPTAGTSFTWAGTNAPSGAPQSSITAVDAAGEWYVDRTTGWVFSYNTIDDDWTVTYIPTVASEMGDSATANIIPDPNTHASYAFQGCKIAYANNTDNSQGYIIYLPPRGPLSATRRTDRCPQSSYDASGNTANFSSTPDSTPVRLWQSGAVDGTVGSYAEHYRYTLPTLITDNWSSGDALPLGLLHLWDPSGTGTTIDGLSFSAESAPSPSSYVLIVSGAAIDSWVSSYIDTVYAGCGGSACLTNRDNHASSYYPAGGLRVVTVGNAVSDAISKLSQAFLEHDHNSANSQPGKQVPHSGLSGLFHPTDNISGPVLVPSSYMNDDHPQYLHRGGMDTNRDKYRGGMLGDLLMLSTNSASDYQNTSYDSNKIIFGSSSGPSMRYSVAETGILMEDIIKFSMYRDSTPSEYFFTYFTGSETVMTTGLNLMLAPIASINLRPLDTYIRFGDVANQNVLSISDHYLQFYNQTVRTFAIGEFSGTPYVLLGPINGMVASYSSGDGTLYFEGGGVPATKENGKIGSNRIFAGNYTHSGTPDSYGQQQGGWGPIRKHPLHPTDFVVYGISSSSNGVSPTLITSSTMTLWDYAAADGHRGMAVKVVAGGYTIGTFAQCRIDLPFAEYGIVNIKFAFKYDQALIAGQGEVQLGFDRFGGSSPAGNVSDSTDFASIRYSGGISPGNWEASGADLIAFSVNVVQPILTVDNQENGYTTIPWVRFWNKSGTPGDSFEFSDIVVLYRIKEW